MARTLWGNILEMLAAGGIQTAAGVGGQLIGDYLKPRTAAKTGLVEAALDTLRTGREPEREAAGGFLKEKAGWDVPRVEASGFVPEGMKPSPTSLMSLADVNRARAGAPYGAFDTATAQRLIRPPVKGLEELAAGTLGGALTGGPEDIGLGASLLNVLKSPKRSEFETLAEMTLGHPDPSIRAAAKAKMDQPSEMMEFRKESAAERQADRELARDAAQERHLDNLGLRQQMLDLQYQEAIRRGDESEQKALGAVLKEHENYIKAWRDLPVNEETILASGRAYNKAREEYAKRYPANVGMLPPEHGEEYTRSWFLGYKRQRPVPPSAPSKKPKAAPAGSVPLTFPRRVRVGGKEMIVNSQEEYDALRQGVSQ